MASRSTSSQPPIAANGHGMSLTDDERRLPPPQQQQSFKVAYEQLRTKIDTFKLSVQNVLDRNKSIQHELTELSSRLDALYQRHVTEMKSLEKFSPVSSSSSGTTGTPENRTPASPSPPSNITATSPLKATAPVQHLPQQQQIQHLLPPMPPRTPTEDKPELQQEHRSSTESRPPQQQQQQQQQEAQGKEAAVKNNKSDDAVIVATATAAAQLKEKPMSTGIAARIAQLNTQGNKIIMFQQPNQPNPLLALKKQKGDVTSTASSASTTTVPVANEWDNTNNDNNGENNNTTMESSKQERVRHDQLTQMKKPRQVGKRKPSQFNRSMLETL